MAYVKKAEQERAFVDMLLEIGIKNYGASDDNGNTYWFFNLEDGQQRYWTNLSEESQKKLKKKKAKVTIK